jgi:hypothetical protein
VNRRSRVELHFADGRIEVVPDTNSARRVLESQPGGSVSAWVVSQNDLGIGQPFTLESVHLESVHPPKPHARPA